MGGSSGGLIPQLLALSWDMNVRKVGVGGQTELGRGERRRAVGTLQLPHSLVPSQEETPLPPPR